MDKKMMKASCDPMCGFSVQSHDDKEVVEFMTKHAKNSHNMAMAEKEVRAMMKPV